jgi:hypothetical protein
MDNLEIRVHHLDETTQWPTGPEEIASPDRKPVGRAVALGAGLVLAGALVGTVGVSVVQAATRNTAATTTQPPAAAAQGGTGTQAVPPGGGFGGPTGGRFGGPQGGGVPGEQRITGTIASIGTSSVSVKTTSGTSTYGVDGSTDIRRDGQTIALSSLTAGETVLLHVLPTSSGSAMYAERILAGTSFGRGGGAPPNGTAPNGTTTTTETGRST